MKPTIDFENFVDPSEDIIEWCHENATPELPAPRIFWLWLCWQADKKMVPAKQITLALGLSKNTITRLARDGLFDVEYRRVPNVKANGSHRESFVNERQVRAYCALTQKEKISYGRQRKNPGG